MLFLLALTSNAWANYYIHGLTNKQDVCSGSNITHFGESGSVCSIPGDNYFIGVSESSDNYYYNTVSADGKSFSDPDGLVESYQVGSDYICSNSSHDGTYKFWYIKLKSAQSVVVAYDGNTLTISKPSWRLCGEFTDWTPAYAPELTGSGTEVSLQMYLPNNTTYPQGTGHGFKIVASTGNTNVWYGCDAVMDKDHCTDYTFATKESANCGLTTYWSGYYTFVFNTSTNKLTINFPAAPTSVPVAYWGAAPYLQNSSTYTDPQREDIVASAYIASQGCSGGNPIAVDKIRVRFWDADNLSVTDVVEVERTVDPYFEINTAYPITIPCDNEILLNCVKSTGKIVMEVAAHNGNGWSAYSDQMDIAYTAPKAFITNNLTGLNFNACDGGHQFTLRDMVKPVPGDWSVVNSSSSADAKADFTLNDGVMIWNAAGKAAGDYSYTFTFNRTGFTDANATLSFHYSAEELTKDIESLTASVSATTPWTEVTLTATYPSNKDFNSVVWSVDKSSGYSLVSSIFGEESTTAVFKGSTVFASTDYNITARGRSANCVTSAGKSVKVTVNEDATDCTQAARVLRAADPVVAVGPRVTLSGYMKYRGNGSGSCVDDYTTYGFCYSTNGSLISSTTDLNVSGVTYKSKTGAALTESNRNWNYTISDGLEANTTYYYKAYMVGVNGTSKVFSDMGSFTTGESCKHPVGDPINYYINASYDENDPCDLMFTNIEDALANLKTHTGSDNDDWWDATNKILKANVIFNVYPGTYGSGISSTIDFSDINKYSSSVTPVKRLTIVGTDATNKPVIYGMYMANSRWITVQNVRVERKTTGSNLTQSSILIGFNDENNARTVGEMTNAGLEFIKCDIEVDGFTCIHANGVDGFYMTGCNLIADRTEAIQDNDRNWGASIKFMNSKNISLLRNNFRGSHANNIFFQNSRETLIMNNVFWNDNKVTYSGSTNNPSFIRLVNFLADNDEHNITKVGIYYNTFYLANSDASGEDSKKFDFIAFGGNAQGGINSRYDVSNVQFKYNNCYSYSTHNTGNSGSQFGEYSISSTFANNNFWSAKSGATSSFAFGSDYQTVDMSLTGGMICSTAPYDPDGLVIRGSGLNLGSKITNDASGMGADKISDDRLKEDARPASGSGWTYGAYQQTLGVEVHTIYWRGTENDKWSNRNNWYKLVDGEYQLVTCVDVLADDLKAVIPEQTGTTKRYPVIPAWESTHEGYNAEGVFTSEDKFAKTIDILYGASVIGVEHLKESGNTYRYYEGINHLEADRKEWLMVGTVIRPFNDLDKAATAADTTARLVKSGDFYRNHLPHIYMQKFGYSGTAVDWDSPFTQLDESVPVDKCFTIFCADQYGPKKRTAAMYYGDASKGKELIEYSFKGRYVAENGLPSYSFTKDNYYFVNNYYPANIKASAFNTDNNVKYYDTKTGAWNDITPGASTNMEIRPQNGVLVVPVSTNTVTLTAEDFTVNSTKYKSVAVNQGLTLSAVATATGKGSNVGVWQQYKNIVKAENASDNDVCELYIPCGGVNLSTISYLDADTVLALGIHNKLYDAMSVRFELVESSLLSEVYLEDRAADPVVRYDLLAGEKPYFANIPAGYSEGRFYLVIGDGQSTEPDVPTEVPAEKTLNFNIDAFVNNSVLTVSVGADATISSITMYDMAGRAYTVPVNGKNFSQSELTVAKGIYTVTVVTDGGTETKKVVVK